jgi:hypothetical protein
MAKNLTHKGNHCTLWIHPLTVWQEVPKSDFQMSKIIRIFLFFFQLKIIVKEQNFCTSQLQDFIRKTLPGAYTIRPSSKAGLNFSDLYRISSYSFRGNYSFLSLEIVANSNSCCNISIFYLINWSFAAQTISRNTVNQLKNLL